MIKKIKPIKIIVAVVTALVFCIALAVPCFADEIDQSPTDYIYKRVYSYDELVSYFDVDRLELSCIVREQMDTVTYFMGEVFFYSDLGQSNVYWHYVAPDAVTNYELRITDNSDTFEFIVTEVPLEGDASSSSYELTWSQFELYVLAPVSSNSSADPSTPSSDMYSNLFNILKDAVYGSDAELTGSQEYALTLISTILTYATILLPIIIVIFIVVWCFKRF